MVIRIFRYGWYAVASKLKAGIVTHLFDRNSLMERLDAHALAAGLEVKDAKRRDDQTGASFRKASFDATAASIEMSRTGDEIDLLDKRAAFVTQHHYVESLRKTAERADPDSAGSA